MRLLSKVVWSEGMHLGPHHFQAQNSYFESLNQFISSALWHEPFGFLAYKLDPEALSNGVVSLVHARGVFPDGLLFQMPELDTLPEPVNIADAFSPISQSLNVSLAVPRHQDEGLNCTPEAASANHHVRYTAVEHILYDETTGRDERKVQLGRKNIRFEVGDTTPEDMVALRLARIVRDPARHYAYDPAFIPPCLKIEASERLSALAARLIDILQQKSAGLSRGERHAGSFAAGFSARDVMTFWYLHAINSGVAALQHLSNTKRGHPEELFIEMSRLGGALCAFKLDSNPASLPLYDHQNLEKCFGELDAHIRLHLEVMAPTNVLTIALQPLGKYLYVGPITDQRCLDRARWILGLHASVGEVELISRTPQTVKVCSAQFVPKLVQRALQGLTLTHLALPPAAVSRRPEFQYFGIERTGPCWEHIVKTREVGIYVPGELPDPEIELSVILE